MLADGRCMPLPSRYCEARPSRELATAPHAGDPTAGPASPDHAHQADQPPEARAGPSGPAMFGLTERELAVLRLLGQGHTNAEIGRMLFISPKTASVHVTNILRKLGAASRVQAATIAERARLLDG